MGARPHRAPRKRRSRDRHPATHGSERHVYRGEPRELNERELERILRQPDGRTKIGKRDRAILLLMADAGLRREEVADLHPDQLEERRRYASPAFRRAVRDSTAMAVRIRGKRGVERLVPLTAAAVDAIAAWVAVRPPASTDRLFVSLPRGRDAGPLSANAVYRRVVRHAEAAGVRPDRMKPHVLRHTFATRCRRHRAPVEVIRDLLGHTDIATTMIYTRVDHQALENAVDALEWAGTPLAAGR